MVNEDQVQEDETEDESSDEVDCSYLLIYSKDEFVQTLIKCIQCKHEYLSKIKSLKKTIRDLSFEKEVLQKSNNEFQTRIEILEIEKKRLQSKCEDLKKLVLKFSKGRHNLDKLLGFQRMFFNKEAIDIIALIKNTKIPLFKRHPKTSLTPYIIIV